MPQDFTAAQVLTAAQMDTLSAAVDGYATTATAAGTTTLTFASMFQQFFTGSTTQTVVMPVASTCYIGWKIRVVNNSSGVVTVQSSGANTIYAVPAGGDVIFTCILASGTTAASWDYKDYTAAGAVSFYGCSVYISASLSTTQNTATIITFNSENFDVGGYHDTGSNTSRITIPTGKSGYYKVSMLGRYIVSTQGYIQLYKNGTGVAMGTVSSRMTGANTTQEANATFDIYLVAGDYIEYSIYSDQATGTNLSAAIFSAYLIGA